MSMKKSFFKSFKNLIGSDIAIIDVLELVHTIELDPDSTKSLGKVEKTIFEILDEEFEDVQYKPNLSNNLKVNVSVDVASELGILVQMMKGMAPAKALSITGKLWHLKKYHYCDGLMLVLVGSETEEKLSITQEIEQICKDMDVAFCYLTM